MYDDKRIVAALEKLKSYDPIQNRARIVVAFDRKNTRDINTGQVRAVLSGSGPNNLASSAASDRPTIYFLRQEGNKDVPKKYAGDRKGWAGKPFWMANVQFSDGPYALMFNLT